MGVWEILDSYQLDTLHRCRAPLSNTAFHTLFSRVFSYCQIFCTFVTKYLISKLKTTQVYFTTQRTVTVHTRTIILILCVLSFSPYKPHAPLYNIPAQPIQYSNTFVTKHLNFELWPQYHIILWQHHFRLCVQFTHMIKFTTIWVECHLNIITRNFCNTSRHF